jgi:hypothetical protein
VDALEIKQAAKRIEDTEWHEFVQFDANLRPMDWKLASLGLVYNIKLDAKGTVSGDDLDYCLEVPPHINLLLVVANLQLVAILLPFQISEFRRV